MSTSKQNKTRVTRIGNPTTYNGSEARITKSADKLVLDPKTGIVHYMYPDNRITRYTEDWKSDPVETEVPEEYYNYWRNAFEQAQANAQPNLLQRGVHWIGRGIEKAGNWLQRFEDGGTTQQIASPEQDVMNTIEAAIGEIQTKRPGQAVQKLAAMMQDPNYSMIIDMIKQEYPQIEGVLNTVEQMVGAYKCGGKTKKKVKKGAKGCVPCKKLMRVGGKLINVWSDCEGNIISKHLVGGRLIPKAEKGLTAEQLAMLDTSHDLNWAKLQAASTTTKTAKEGYSYYIGDDQHVYRAIAQLGLDGSFRWVKIDPNTTEGKALTEAELLKANIQKGTGESGTFTLNGKTLPYFSTLGDAYTENVTKAGDIQYYHNGQWNTASATEDGNGGYFWSSGRAAVIDDFGDDDMRTGLTKADLTRGSITADLARAAGIDVSQFDENGKYQISSNPLLGTKSDATTALNTYGSMGLARQLQRQKRNIGREAWRDARARNRLERSTNVIPTYKSYKDSELSRIDHTGQVTAAINAIDAKYKNSASSNSGSTSGSGSGSGSGSTTATTNIKPIFKTDKNKQGGWLTKFLDGGLAYPKAETMYFDPQTRSRLVITNKKLEGKLLPAGTIITQTTGEWMKGFPSQIVDSYASNPANYIYERKIKYGVTPSQNDTVYTTRFVGKPIPQMSELAKIKFNNEYYKQ